MPADSDARLALRELIALLQEIDERYLGDEWSAPAFGDLPDGFRSVANMVEGGFFLMFDSDPERPFFRPIVSRTRKMLGDNPDALYYTAPVRSDRAYRVTGNLAGCASTCRSRSRRDTEEGGYSTETAGVLRDRDFDVAADGSFEVFFGGADRASQLARPCADGASELIVRCYFEEAEPAAADPNRSCRSTIEPRRPVPAAPRRGTTPRSRRASGGSPTSCAAARSSKPKPGEREQPTWVSTTPNVFPTAGAAGHVRVRRRRRGVLDGAVRARRRTRRW